MISAKSAIDESVRRGVLSSGRRLLVALAIAVALLLWPIKPPSLGWSPLWWDWMHVPLFAWLGWEAARFLRVRGRSGWRGFAIVMLGATMVATGAELLQHAAGRQSDWKDLARSLSGSLAGCSLFLAARVQGLKKVGPLLLAVISLVAGSHALIQRAIVLREKASVFPLLEDFETTTSLSLWSLEHDGSPKTLRRIHDAGGWHLAMPIALKGFSSLHYDAQCRDWTPYESLVLKYRFEGTSTLHLGVRLDADGDGAQRKYLETHLKSGSHLVAVPLLSSQDKPFDFSQVRTLTFFSAGGTEGTLFIEELRLE